MDDVRLRIVSNRHWKGNEMTKPLYKNCVIIFGAAVMLFGCNSGEATSAAAAVNETPNAVPTVQEKISEKKESAQPQATPPKTDLTVYVGKYPFDEVNGAKFIDNPMVKAAIDSILPETEDRKFIRETYGLDFPIFAKNGRVVGAGCANRACDTYNWTIAISPDGSQAEICLYRGESHKYGADAADDWRNNISSLWYDREGSMPMTIGTCPANAENYPPQVIVAG